MFDSDLLGQVEVAQQADGNAGRKLHSARGNDPLWLRVVLISAALLSVGLLIGLPVLNVFSVAFSRGWKVYWECLIADPDTRHAIFLSLTIVPIAVSLNFVFGIAAAWAVARFSFPGRSALIALIDLPFSVSPVVAGLMLILIFGLQGILGSVLREDGYQLVNWGVSLIVAAAACIFLNRRLKRSSIYWKLVAATLVGVGVFASASWLQTWLGLWPEKQSIRIVFAWPGLVLATAFVTMPFIARELIPLMEAIGPEEELAALSLGASGWQMYWRVTLPNIKWGLMYGLILCGARALGEFGAVYVVSGHITGRTDTLPLRIEKLFQDYNLPGAFAVASVLTSAALLSLFVKTWLHGKLQNAGSRRVR